MEQRYSKDRNQGQWIEASDRIYVAAYSSVASLSITFTGYFRKLNGEIIQFQETLAPTSDRAVTSKTVTVGAGFLISLVAYIASGNANRGQCYVQARVQRSTGTPQVILANLIGGYVTDNFQPSFPYGKIEGSLSGVGNIRWILGVDPAAGADYSATVPTGAFWFLRTVEFTIRADANAADREGRVYLDDTVEPEVVINIGKKTVANDVHTCSFGVGMTRYDSAVSTRYYAPLPDMRLRAGDRVRFRIYNIQVGDTISGIYYQVEEWLEA